MLGLEIFRALLIFMRSGLFVHRYSGDPLWMEGSHYLFSGIFLTIKMQNPIGGIMFRSDRKTVIMFSSLIFFISIY